MSTRSLALLAVLCAGCAAVTARPGASYVAEGLHHVLTTAVVARDADGAAVEVMLQSLRDAPGNLAVMLLRRDGELTIVAEWRSADDARHAGGALFEVLFEAADFERLEVTVEEVPNSRSASSHHSGASSQIARDAP